MSAHVLQPPELVQGVLAGGAPALLRSSEGLEDSREGGRQICWSVGLPELMPWCIAAGGTTPMCMAA